MTFRIDQIRRRPDGIYIEFKGVEGKGQYGQFLADANGLSLLQADESRHVILDKFKIDCDASDQVISRFVASVLHDIGWGPEVNQTGSIVESATYDWQKATR